MEKKHRNLFEDLVNEYEGTRCSDEYCETPYEDLTYAPDPFRSEIAGDDTEIWLCSNCRYKSVMEI